MTKFLDEHFLLSTPSARQLFHEYAAPMPILDYHCHLPPELIAKDHRFENLTQIWLYGDHYKWRAMRTNGVDESYCTGAKSDAEKFEKWAETVPYTLRNPLYHWTHLELQRYFNIREVLNPRTAAGIYRECSDLLQTPAFSVRNLLRRMKVALICTTDDPLDSLEYHRQLKEEAFEIPVLPAFRPDRAMNISDPETFRNYLGKLEEVSGMAVNTFDSFLSALKSRHDYFVRNGCRVSDHGLEEMYAEDFTESEIRAIYMKVLRGGKPDLPEGRKFKSAMLLHFAHWDWENGLVQQYHLGALRNNNTRMMRLQGADAGWDSIGDFPQAAGLARFLDRLDRDNRLAKTILYNLNPADNEVMATMAGNFNDGSVAGKVQWGAAWWFLDQKDGMEKQLNTLSNMGLLSRFVGMLTDSRSFLSYPRHEYFRRILCNLFGKEMAAGELPADMELVGGIVKNICYHNANQYFNWDSVDVTL
ncbi:D-glucuronate isomerase [Anseongella ginsenosidimutans]|uniref:Uronate isomerase n=1 Tax=Anseongella ginsenosidimutans TaxID=496056 RepID=A0A4R3KNZ8_9SPHI|nr:glucuronate isomerase [Anseongella ginsenosidimutans]QEC53774.1 glucuronate isomerase [Anseongella ginsenosidimutans]TCS84916.1 D-glucuronate isomerase [Anseongella ginsenosidimutans]